MLSALSSNCDSFKWKNHIVLLIAWGTILLGYWRGINNQLPVLSNFTDELECLIVVLPIIFTIRELNKTIALKDYLFWIFCFIAYSLNFIIFPENEDALSKRYFNFSLLTLPFYFAGILTDIEKLQKYFYYISAVSICICALYEIIWIQSAMYTGDLNAGDYNMGHSYDILPHVLMVTWYALRNFDIKRIIFMLIGAFMLISYGTRGPVLCFILFVIGYFLFFKNFKHAVTIKILVGLIGLLLFLNIDPIMLFLNELTSDLGMSSRLFDLYFNNQIEASDTRDALKDTLLAILKREDPMFGFGLLGSYRFIHTYPHKIWLEFIFSFGWILGITLFAILVLYIIRAFFKCKSEDEKVFLFILMVCGFFKLFLSGTFLDETLLFFLLGYCTNITRKYHR